MSWFACECRINGPVAIEAEKGPDCYDRSQGYEWASVLHKPFATREEAMAYWGEPALYCRECGHRINLNYIEDERRHLIEKGVCFRCHHWMRFVNNRNSIVIDGKHYIAGTQRKPDQWNGFGGTWFHIRMNDGAEIHTCDLWFQGEIPEHFRERIPNNATFMNGAKWHRIGDTWYLDNPHVEGK